MIKNKRTAYYELINWGDDDTEIQSPPEWDNMAKGKYYCCECAAFFQRVDKFDIPVQKICTTITVSTILFSFANIASHQLFEAIGWDLVKKWLILGNLTNEKGEKIEGFSSYQGKRIAFVRGDRPFPSSNCKHCGIVQHYPSSSKHYLIREEIDPNVPIYVNGIGDLVVSGDIYKKIKDLKLPNLKLRKLPMVDKSNAPANQVSFDFSSKKFRHRTPSQNQTVSGVGPGGHRRFSSGGPERQTYWDARISALTSILGKPSDAVLHSAIPFQLGGAADVLIFPEFIPGITYVTAEMSGEDAGQRPSSIGNFELMICSRQEFKKAAELISNLARYTCDEVLEAGETLDIGTFFGDSNIHALLFTHPREQKTQFELLGNHYGLLLCIGITKEELAFKRAHGSQALLVALRVHGVFPYTILNRPSVPLP